MGGGHPAPPHPFILQNCVYILFCWIVSFWKIHDLSDFKSLKFFQLKFKGIIALNRYVSRGPKVSHLKVELDDFLIASDSFGNCLRDTNLVVSFFQYFGFKLNFCKCILTPTQRIEFLGLVLDSRSCTYYLTKAKESKFCLILIALSKLRSIRRKLMERSLGFLNFCCHLVPIFRSLVRPWYTEWHNSALNRMVFSHFPCQPLLKVLHSGKLVFSWSQGGNEQFFPVFVDATPFCVAGISGRGCFVRSLSPPLPIFEAELLAILLRVSCIMCLFLIFFMLFQTTRLLVCISQGLLTELGCKSYFTTSCLVVSNPILPGLLNTLRTWGAYSPS